MSLAGQAAEPVLSWGLSRESGGGVGIYRLPVYVACTVLAVVSNYLLGKDMAWDTLNYHLYAGLSAVQDRLSQDYFAAGPQSYFNPYVYVPFYGLVAAGLSALQIGSVLALVHSVILWLTFELAVSIYPSADRRERAIVGVCAVALAFLNPILLQQIGSSFGDITTAILALAGWVLLVGAVRTPDTARIACGGLLLGIATALKLTNAVHAIAGFAVLIMVPQSLRARIRSNLGFGVALGIGFAIVMAPWSYRLEHQFGNPLFPLLNGVFCSPEFTSEPLKHFRFIPETLSEALWRPFALLNPVRGVHEELSAPDLRYAVVVLLAAVLIWRRLRQRPEPSTAWRALAALGCGLTLDWALWLSNSGNGRYFLPMDCVAAVVAIALLFRLFADRPKVLYYSLFAILGIQALQVGAGTEFRWNPVPWNSGPQFDVSVPEKLASEPDLYLTMGMQSNSFIAAFLPKGAGLINFSGGYALGPDGANGEQVQALMHRYAPHLRVLVRGARLYADDEHHEPRRSEVDEALARFSVRVDPSDCATITVHGLPPDLEITTTDERSALAPQPRDVSYLISCRVSPVNIDRSAELARLRDVDIVLNRLEDACPRLFQPRRLVTEHTRDTWRRFYMNTDLTAWVSNGLVRFRDPKRGGGTTIIGRESDWEKGPLKLACGRRDGHYFAHVLESEEGP